ncbi:hypothetical protein A6D98_06335 [Aliivibrio fischeri]|uniref:AbiU2 domain-containing protein n=1 Tax=Aliivibrio fischeri TaxID=668 RepID=UPI00080EE239|nr:hypothetical protein [Aliivibrio fischeri]OCH62179.1 hypothetical protein A6D98_06335 [Aliivibrio fischeri]
MSDIVEKLAKLEPNLIGEPLGIDDLVLTAIHQRAFIEALNAVECQKFKRSYIFQSILIGSTYSVIMSIMKSYDRQTREEDINTLRKLLNKVKNKKNEVLCLLEHYDTRNLNSVFEPLKNYRDKTLAHNEMMQTINWNQVDKALLVTVEVWSFVEEQSKSKIMFPFYKFESVSCGLEQLLSTNDLLLAKNAWKNFIFRIHNAYQSGKCL